MGFTQFWWKIQVFAMLLAAGIQLLPELNGATPHQNSNHAPDLWFLLGQMHQRGKGEEWEGIYE